MKANHATYLCSWCSEPIIRIPSNLHKHMFCSRRCYNKWLKTQTGALSKAWRGGPPEFTCPECGNKFRSHAGTAMVARGYKTYCSKQCMIASRTGTNSPRWKGLDKLLYQRIWKANHQVKLAGGIGLFTAEEWLRLLAECDHKCASRKKPQTKRRTLTMDHIIPVSRGGAGWIRNIQPLCINCNCRKSTRTIYFREGFEVTDIRKVPAEFLQLNERTLDYLAQNYATNRIDIPGIEFREVLSQ